MYYVKLSAIAFIGASLFGIGLWLGTYDDWRPLLAGALIAFGLLIFFSAISFIDKKPPKESR